MALHPDRPRLVPRTRGETIQRLNIRQRWWQDVYHDALAMSWTMFLLWSVVAYVLINAAFAGLYLLQPGSLANARPGSFTDAFFFSVQCISTIGFGGLAPATLYANLLTTAEAIVSLAIVALATGSVFARISRPRARVMFARHAVIGTHDGVPTLFIRIANERSTQILAAEVQVTVLRFQQTAEGQTFRRFYDVRLSRSRTPIFALTFTVMHTIDEDSPLWGASTDSMAADDTECLITVTGMEETTSQIVHARYSYGAEEIVFGRRYRDIFGLDDQGRRTIDYGWFHETEPAA
ncbi:MAG: ATP-sensitive inward rectifier potassium channel 10 [Sphingomonas sp.]|nr:MAG: ATP-sensitive inward rectifier potassium channel 10 [Sphingomonas sp.]